MRVFTLVLCFAAPSWYALAQPSLDAGEKLYSVCAGCHGFVAEGNELVAAPRLAGLEPWYIARQMRNFAAGIRGASSGDAHGQRMSMMAGAVKNDRDLDDVVAYIATLPSKPEPERGAGNVETGRQRYALCAACHGANAEGNEALSAPALAGLDEWYVVEQLRLFAEGLRGSNSSDTYGQQMRALGGTFADDDARRDLAAYLATIRP